MSRPTVALVAHAVHDHGGMERAFAELVRRGHDRCRFVVFSAELEPELRPLVEWRRIRVPMRPIPLKNVAFALVAGLRLSRARVDLVHTMGALVPNRSDFATVQFCVAGFRGKVRRLAPADSPPVRRLNTGLARRIGLWLERWCYRPGRVRALGAVSPGVADELRSHYPGLAVAVTPNGVDLSRFRPDEHERARLRREEGVEADELVAVFVAGGWDHKGLGIAIEALAEPGAGRIRLWVVGRGPEARFRAVAATKGVAERVRFFGARTDVERFLQAADVFVLPTLYESFSLVAYEAAAAGLPVVATQVNGIEDLPGLVVERTAPDVGAALARLAEEPELRRNLGAAGRRHAQSYGWERSVESVLGEYARLQGEPA